MPVEVRDKLRRLVLTQESTGHRRAAREDDPFAALLEVLVSASWWWRTPELMPTHPHVVVWLRAKEMLMVPARSMRLLLRQCPRMRPDRIVVGEVRGAEVADLLVARIRTPGLPHDARQLGGCGAGAAGRARGDGGVELASFARAGCRRD